MKLKPEQTEQITESVVLDEKDILILRALQENAKATVSDISKRVHLSNSPTFDRIKRLEQQGVIKQYTALLDVRKINKSLMVICYVSLKEHNKTAGSKFVKRILELNEVIECYSISGEFDFMLKVVSSDMQAYYHFHVNVLSQVENVGHIQSNFVMGTIKETLVSI